MYKIFITIALVLLSIGMYSQNYEIPKNYTFEKPEDYAKYEMDILKCIDWLLNTPLNEQTVKRKEANAFVMKWISGSPNVTIEMNPKIVNFMKPNPDLLMIFMCGWTRYSLESREFNNKLLGNQKGIETVIDFYNKNKAFLKKDRNIEKYKKMKDKEELEEYIKTHTI
jgi:hypothetical protein